MRISASRSAGARCARPLLSFFLASLLLIVLPIRAQQEPEYTETIDVIRYVLTVRATGPDGVAIRDLRPEEFVVTIDGRRAEVEAADWIGAESAAAVAPSGERPPIAGGTAPAPELPAGRSIVFFVQTDFARASLRLRGQMNFNAMARQFIGMFEERDRIAVVSFDSHLKLRLDFTTDKESVVGAVRTAIHTSKAKPLAPAAEPPSLASILDAGEMERAATSEAALLLLAEAFAQVEGEKVLVLAAWGFGDLVFGTPWIFYEPEWPVAIRTLQTHRIPVISLGTGMGGELTSSLVSVAQQTGGFYAGTQLFVHQGLQKVDSFLEGRYELVIRIASPLAQGDHQIKASVTRGGANLIAPAKVVIVPQSRPKPPPVMAEPEMPSPAEMYAGAMQLLLDGEAKLAEELLTQLLDRAPAYTDAWYERGMLRATMDDRTGAAADLRRYLQLAPRGTHAEDAAAFLETLSD